MRKFLFYIVAAIVSAGSINSAGAFPPGELPKPANDIIRVGEGCGWDTDHSGGCGPAAPQMARRVVTAINNGRLAHAKSTWVGTSADFAGEINASPGGKGRVAPITAEDVENLDLSKLRLKKGIAVMKEPSFLPFPLGQSTIRISPMRSGS
jgi:hypothetical protein